MCVGGGRGVQLVHKFHIFYNIWRTGTIIFQMWRISTIFSHVCKIGTTSSHNHGTESLNTKEEATVIDPPGVYQIREKFVCMFVCFSIGFALPNYI